MKAVTVMEKRKRSIERLRLSKQDLGKIEN